MADERDQDKIIRLLRLVGPGPTAFYRDAVRLLSEDVAVESLTHLVAHLMREINSAVLSVLDPLADSGLDADIVAERQDKVRKALEGEAISQSVVGSCLRELGKAVQATRIGTALKALGIAEDDEIAQKWLGLSARLHGLTHRSALDPPRDPTEEFYTLWSDFQTVLLFILDRLEASFLRVRRLLDTLLSKEQPSRKDAKTLKNAIPNSLAAHAYFFSRAPSAWLDPLGKEGIFKKPPKPEPVPGGDGYRLFRWPQSVYLARVAGEQPELVRDIILAIPEAENIFVHHDFLEAALAMPPAVAAPLADSAQIWISCGFQPVWPEKYGELIKHLAAGGELAAALGLAKALLSVFPKPLSSLQEEFKRPPDVCGHFDAWYYREIVKHYVPALVAAAKDTALALLCNLLKEAVRSTLKDEDKDGHEDYSHAWRRDIAYDLGEHEDDFRSVLATAVRDAGMQLIDADPSSVSKVIAQLETGSYRVFDRISLYILAAAASVPVDLIVDKLRNVDLFNGRSTRKEYDRLVEERFAGLQESAREEILRVFADWPNRKAISAARELWFGHKLSEEEVEEIAKRHRLERLAPFSKGLPSEWKEEYEDLVTKLGEPEALSGSAPRAGVWVEELGAKGELDLGGKSPEEVVAALRGYEQRSEKTFPEIRDPSSQLESLVHSGPAGFSASAPLFSDLDLKYVLALLQGFHGALLQGKRLAWKPILDLCLKLIGVRSLSPNGSTEVNDEPWLETRLAIIRLIAEQLQRRPAEIPPDERADVWKILRFLSEDEHPSTEEEAQQRLGPRDYESPVLKRFGRQPSGSFEELAGLQWSAIRALALRGVIFYGLWVNREEERVSTDLHHDGLEGLAEVREILDLHLDLRHDPSLVVRSVYGELFPYLVEFDRKWAMENAQRVFPMTDDQWQAGWIPYVVQNPSYDKTFEVLRDQYGYAIDQIGTILLSDWSDPNSHPDRQLAAHLMQLCWRGKIEIDGAESLLAKFFAKAPDSLRAFALEFVGRSLKNTDEEVVPEYLARLQYLWEWRLRAARETPGGSYKEEMGAFGWWFVSSKLPETWSMNQLAEALALAEGVSGRGNRIVVSRLAKVASKMPAETVKCLAKIIESDEENIVAAGPNADVRGVLAAALHSGDKTAALVAREVINRLSARGHSSFEDLLENTSLS